MNQPENPRKMPNTGMSYQLQLSFAELQVLYDYLIMDKQNYDHKVMSQIRIKIELLYLPY
jgi:hypothetical protein